MDMNTIDSNLYFIQYGSDQYLTNISHDDHFNDSSWTMAYVDPIYMDNFLNHYQNVKYEPDQGLIYPNNFFDKAITTDNKNDKDTNRNNGNILMEYDRIPNQDLNQDTNDGVYGLRNMALTNSPLPDGTHASGVLKVFGNHFASSIYQIIYFDVNASQSKTIFYRQEGQGVWTQWKPVGSSEGNANSGSGSDSGGNTWGAAVFQGDIPTNDLNALTTPGVYMISGIRCQNSPDGQLNYPWADWGSVRVFNINRGGLAQIYYTSYGTNNMTFAYRVQGHGIWDTWNIVANDTDIRNLQNSKADKDDMRALAHSFNNNLTQINQKLTNLQNNMSIVNQKLGLN